MVVKPSLSKTTARSANCFCCTVTGIYMYTNGDADNVLIILHLTLIGCKSIFYTPGTAATRT